MRAPKRRHPPRNAQFSPHSPHQLRELSDLCSYIISTEHKSHYTSAGPGNLRSDASACPPDIDRAQAETWLKAAVLAGNVSADFDNDFPHKVWFRVRANVYEARLSNSILGQYKGYPIQPMEAPAWLA